MDSPQRLKRPGPSPESLAKSGLEEGEQTALFCWFAMNTAHTPELAYAFAIPNGGERNKIVAARLKASGVRRGVPDIMIPAVRYVDGKWWAGLWIELKKTKGGNANNPDQLRWAEWLKGQGYAHFLCRGYLQAQDAVKWYFGPQQPWS